MGDDWLRCGNRTNVLGDPFLVFFWDYWHKAVPNQLRGRLAEIAAVGVVDKR
jgi:hypothetical protein